MLAAVALGAVALVGAEVSQRDDWLVGGSGATAQLRVERSAGGQVTALSLENGLVQRAFTVRGGALCTTEYKNLVSEQTFFRAISPEANITLNGHGFDVGGCDGQPNKTMEFVRTRSSARRCWCCERTARLMCCARAVDAGRLEGQPDGEPGGLPVPQLLAERAGGPFPLEAWDASHADHAVLAADRRAPAADVRSARGRAGGAGPGAGGRALRAVR